LNGEKISKIGIAGRGFVDFAEFSAPMQTLFAQLDRNKDGIQRRSGRHRR
jgi:hypothetical protein